MTLGDIEDFLYGAIRIECGGKTIFETNHTVGIDTELWDRDIISISSIADYSNSNPSSDDMHGIIVIEVEENDC